ncbi:MULTISPECIES: DeoR/GlpR family DNA-binding transcription regulator [Clostridium]|uniref:Lactose phosphotransferase system repressor n=1 Tax=Clostridium cadaveris TaxID=1529 RepID=A0A1I2MDC4_9CLOT|nr:DeoR/GlpR family DNA-binding transcription regulator [Clostridium cadaveris]MDU4953931.1 DeoR/GlpR family DNA-binding transcription regulator [Clostridium sp.]MDM8311493.1 DeoR/GlpR family DNA-binding transcription regulator [Clostridium cadaveris]NME64889.1 DeoR/GlpR transcriptional regulator [Clostridium cadaveris]PWL53896.1 MAG: DeoR/GlpR transcriptional regulator [Clostridium cadaveris]SFF89465.1 transcriptional regulator, DeoR family [Clostridium cadaveris]
MNERHTRIVNIVNKSKKIEVNALAEMLGVSPVTIRKDLGSLEEKGLLSREHGYAVMLNTDDINNRLAVCYETKVKIAKAAANMVSSGETVMIESGSSCALLAGELSNSDKDVTIITNSAFIAGYVRENGDSRVILLGGEYQKESQVMVGPLVRICAREFHVDKLFVGTDGFNPDYGFSGSDMMRTEAMKCLAESARKVILLTDSSKFEKQGVVMQLRFDELQGIVTDSEIPDSAKKLLEDKNIEITIV